MDHTQARELAVAEFASRQPGGRLRDGDWDVSGPREVRVRMLDGVRRQLVFDFVPRAEIVATVRVPKLMISVDPDTGDTYMLR